MEFFEDTIKARFSFVSKIKLELLLISLAALFMIASVVFFLSVDHQKGIVIDEDGGDNTNVKEQKSVFVDIAGAVEKPGVYDVPTFSRLKDALVKAGGLSLNADRDFFSKHFNLARILKDEEKIYIPTRDEVLQGYMIDRTTTTVKGIGTNNQADQSKKININSASQNELESLPGVGEVTASKIIDNRPYGSLEELLEKKVVNKSTFEKIKELVTL